jgi:hypothetical protein
MKLALDFGIDSGPRHAQDDPITDFLEGDRLDPAQKRELRGGMGREGTPSNDWMRLLKECILLFRLTQAEPQRD